MVLNIPVQSEREVNMMMAHRVVFHSEEKRHGEKRSDVSDEKIFRLHD